jgi:coproporphyrinogen III oxidase
MLNNLQKITVSDYFMSLATKIKNYIESIDDKKFEAKPWIRQDGGGGIVSVLYGNIFEKIGVNISTVYGTLIDDLAQNMPNIGNDKTFWASGLSLVSHPKNPFMPPIHMNVRCLSTKNSTWFGGAIDLNPIYKYDADTSKFHEMIKNVCDKHDLIYYPKFSAECDEYFTIKHRNEKRGIGGIFFDYLNTDFDKNWSFTKDIGDNFCNIYDVFIQKYLNTKWTEKDRDYQLIRRGRYAEFNLIYDRGIKFGLMTGGNPDGMFMSLPPLVKWE